MGAKPLRIPTIHRAVRVATSPPAEPTKSAIQPALMTRQEVALYLAVSSSLIKKLTLDGSLPAARVGGRICRYRKSDVDAYVNGLMTPRTTGE